MFTAQPLASSMGPKLRWRSRNHASSIAGPEMSSSSPSSTSGICHSGRRKKPLMIAANAVPSIPSAKPMAAKMPAKRAMSKAWLGAVAGAAPGSAAAAPLADRASTCCSRAAARRCACALIKRAKRRYGIQNAWRTLMGASTTRSTCAFQSRPWRS